MRFLRQLASGQGNKHTNHKSHNTLSKHGETCREKVNGEREHQEHVAYSGEASEHYMAMVHTPIPMGQAMRIPAAKAAVEKEWKKLEDKNAWMLDTVKPRAEVIRDAKARSKRVYFGSLMDLCHVKHSELAKHLQKYKGSCLLYTSDAADE